MGNDINAIKEKIWHVSGRNLYLIVIAKARLGWFSNEVPFDYEKLLIEVKRLKATKILK